MAHPSKQQTANTAHHDLSLAELGGAMPDFSSQQRAVNTSDLQISPAQLKFRYELHKTVEVTLSLHNTGPYRVAFKVKAMAPDRYWVLLRCGVVKPGATNGVQLIMLPQQARPASLAGCKDQFLVQTLKVNGGVSKVESKLFDIIGSSVMSSHCWTWCG